ncbi:hypothetical protein [uncultured Christiangramia sp.]|uniref:hypothetical protein n=1 Tax=uncultured Christiangramia sp. TaxID=503836 RepID=UPI0025D2A97D|nr:hypothetical protein [uncultured Christiangramia sp.]
MHKKKVLFHKIHGRSSKIFISLALVCLVLYGVDYFNDMFGRFDSVLLFSAHLILLLFWSRMIFNKSVVSWNKLGINIKMKGIWGSSLLLKRFVRLKLQKVNLLLLVATEKHQFLILNMFQYRIGNESQRSLIDIARHLIMN